MKKRIFALCITLCVLTGCAPRVQMTVTDTAGNQHVLFSKGVGDVTMTVDVAEDGIAKAEITTDKSETYVFLAAAVAAVVTVVTFGGGGI